MSHRLRRFLHLERERPAREGETSATPAPSAGRIEAVQRPAGPGPRAATRSGAELGRFGPEPEPVVELLETDGKPAFSRCLRCGMDSHVLATACPGCGADLDTPEQRAFSERLWEKLAAERAREEAASAERRRTLDADAAAEGRARRALAEEMAREVGESERRRLDAELGRGGWGGFGWGRRRRRASFLDLILDLFTRW